MMPRLRVTFLATAWLAASAGAEVATSNRTIELPGQRDDGSVLLPNQWSLQPAGRQIALGDFPVNISLHPGGQYAAVLHCGYGAHEVVVMDLRTEGLASRTPIAEGFYGIEFSSDGRTLFCSGAAAEVVRGFSFESGKLKPAGEISLRDPKRRGIPGGLAVTRDGRTLCAANVWGQGVAIVDIARTHVQDVLLGPDVSPPATAPAGPTPDPDAAAITKRAQAALDPTSPDAPFPYACRIDEERGRLYVSLWARSRVALIDLKTGRVTGHWPTEEHPNEMALSRDGRRLFVANASRNSVTVFDTADGRVMETLWAAPYPGVPPGSTPNSLALSPDEKTLFVANACNNTVAVFDVSKPGKSRSLGLIPVGWYPTSVRVTLDGRRLLVANGKGGGSRANPKGPQPTGRPPGTLVQYIGGLFRGSLSLIDLPDRSRAESQFREWTASALRCCPLRPDLSATAVRPEGNPVPARPGEPSPIRHCVYVIKENRTYDQVFGDMPEGNGDPSLCLFPERVTPNHHRLAREFVLLDNFYVESEVSADGHEWTVGAYATDFVEKTWPLVYGHGGSGKYPYPSEGSFPIAAPAGGYLWDRAREAGLSYRSYGEFINNGRTPNDPGRAKVRALEGHFDPRFRGFDMGYSDLKRADRFLEELRGFEKDGEMPRLILLRLPNDHTAGTSAGMRTPTAFVAENDLALGRVIEGLSRSRFWPETAVFIVEDDAQNGPDHVDAHRTVALVVSPYSRSRGVDSTLYSTASMLRTMELMLGLKPMTQFDAAARPMYGAFHSKSDLRPYEARPANVDLTALNPATAWGADQSRRMDFSREDAADDLLLNEVIWRSVRGADTPMPAPVRAAFVLARADEDDD